MSWNPLSRMLMRWKRTSSQPGDHRLGAQPRTRCSPRSSKTTRRRSSPPGAAAPRGRPRPGSDGRGSRSPPSSSCGAARPSAAHGDGRACRTRARRAPSLIRQRIDLRSLRPAVSAAGASAPGHDSAARAPDAPASAPEAIANVANSAAAIAATVATVASTDRNDGFCVSVMAREKVARPCRRARISKTIGGAGVAPRTARRGIAAGQRGSRDSNPDSRFWRPCV